MKHLRVDELLLELEKELGIKHKPVKLIDQVKSILCKRGLSGIDLDDKTEKFSVRLGDLISKKYDEDDSKGRQPILCLNPSDNTLVQGATFCAPTDPLDVKAQKENRARQSLYVGVMGELSEKEFEILCTKLLELLGVPKPILSPYVRDEGIDFYGELSLGDLVGHGPVFRVFETNIKIWLVGQAKHYKKSKVATPDLRDLVGAINLGRAKAFGHVQSMKAYENLRIRACDPVIALFFTTGEVSKDSQELCNNAGISFMDGNALASFLADKRIGLDIYNNFDKTIFLTWLKT